MSIKRATEVVPLYQGDDMARLEELRVDATAARLRHEEAQRGPRRMGDDTAAAVEETRAAFDAFVDEAAERAEEVTVQALSRVAFRDLRLAHQPRPKSKVVEGEETEGLEDVDALFGVNVETFPDALLKYVDREDETDRTIVSPEFPTPAALKKWLDRELTEGQFDSLWQTAWRLNKQGASDPKALRFSPPTQTPSETSELPAP